jgi:hypothetical protein
VAKTLISKENPPKPPPNAGRICPVGEEIQCLSCL